MMVTSTYTFRKLSDLKNRARRVAREENLSRHEALDVTARCGGYQNYLHAVDQLPEAETAPRHRVEIHQYWREREKRLAGFTTLVIELDTPLTTLVKLHQLKGYLGGCAILDEGRIRIDGFMTGRDESERDVLRLARALQFMDATGLKPSGARNLYPKRKWDNRPPIADHDHGWHDPDARMHILSTEPYPGRAQHAAEAHCAWEARHGWKTFRVERDSIYGFGTEFYLLCPASHAPALQAKIARFLLAPPSLGPERLVLTERPLLRTA